MYETGYELSLQILTITLLTDRSMASKDRNHGSMETGSEGVEIVSGKSLDPPAESSVSGIVDDTNGAANEVHRQIKDFQPRS